MAAGDEKPGANVRGERVRLRVVEAFVVTLIGTIGLCFAYEIFSARPLWLEAAWGFLPRAEILRNNAMLCIAIGILGATVMPLAQFTSEKAAMGTFVNSRFTTVVAGAVAVAPEF